MKIDFSQLKYLLVIVPFFSSFMLIEMYISRRKNLSLYLSQDTWANFAILILRSALNFLGSGALIYLLLAKASVFSLHLCDHLDKFAYWGLLVVGQDFFYYWFHRYSHECRWGWASHVVHHSSNYVNYVTAVRESVTYVFSGIWVFWLPLVILGFHVQDILIVTGASLVYQFFLHTRLIGKLGWYECLFNTPSHHRVHHARNPEYVDKNYGGTLIIWDRLFGTFAAETVVPDFGLVHQIYNYNPLYILFHGWYEMFREVIKQRSLKYFLVFPKSE